MRKRRQGGIATTRSGTAIRAALVLVAATLLLRFGSAEGYQRALAPADDVSPPFGLSADCVLQHYNVCSCYLWVYTDQEHAVWGSIFDPQDCPGGCATGGAVKEVLLYTQCVSPPVTLGGIRIQSVDAANCPTALLYQSGPIEIVHCIGYDQWTSIPIPLIHVGGQRFVVQVEWGPTGSLELASDDPEKNFHCWTGVPEGCLRPDCTCYSWELPSATSFIYVTDRDGDGTLDDLCGKYGAPELITTYYLYHVGYVPNNLLMSVVLDCEQPTRTEGAAWGRIKHLFE